MRVAASYSSEVPYQERNSVLHQSIHASRKRSRWVGGQSASRNHHRAGLYPALNAELRGRWQARLC